jgi:hypothetical protein
VSNYTFEGARNTLEKVPMHPNEPNTLIIKKPRYIRKKQQKYISNLTILLKKDTKSHYQAMVEDTEIHQNKGKYLNKFFTKNVQIV